jgi:hypothetical protein
MKKWIDLSKEFAREMGEGFLILAIIAAMSVIVVAIGLAGFGVLK